MTSDTAPLAVGIIGCGGYAGAHARRWAACDEVRITALCSRRLASTAGLIERRLADYTPAPACYDDPAVMYRAEQLDAVAIVTPHASHVELALAALDAGCHVLVEKPIATDPESAAQLAERAAACGRHVVPCYNPPFTAPVQYLRQAIADGRFGDLRMVTAYLAQDWRRLTAASWRQDPAQAGLGQCGDSGAHLLAGLCWALGAEPDTVQVLQDRRGSPVDIDTGLLLGFPRGVIASVAVVGDCGREGSHASFCFTDGRVDIDLWRGGWITVDAEAECIGELPATGAEADPNRHLVDVLRGRSEPLVDAAFGVGQCRLMATIAAAATVAV